LDGPLLKAAGWQAVSLDTMKYDPQRNAYPSKWLSLSDLERLDLVEAYHSAKNILLPNSRLHAIMHVIVENQIAQGDRIPVKAPLVRLVIDGLDRHDALHAIGSVLAVQMHEILTATNLQPQPNQQYFDALSQLTAASWLESSHS